MMLPTRKGFSKVFFKVLHSGSSKGFCEASLKERSEVLFGFRSLGFGKFWHKSSFPMVLWLMWSLAARVSPDVFNEVYKDIKMRSQNMYLFVATAGSFRKFGVPYFGLLVIH